MAKRIDTVTITIDAQAAREEMAKLKKRSDELGKAIAEMKKQLEDPGLQKTSAQWKQLNKQYKDAKQEQKELNNLVAEGEQSIKGMNDVLSNLSKATYNDLIKQQRTLSRAIKSAKPNTKDYKELQTALRAVNNRVDELRKGWAAHDSQIVAVAKRLASYVAIYGGFNFVVGKLKSVVSETLKLSDAMADVQKTTGIAGVELQKLSKEIDAIDTRTSQLEMHNLAAVAGQIGLKETQDILGFVSASNQLTVALNELGDDGVQSLAKIAQLTGDIEILGVEKSLLSIGSSINELSANSAASAGPIADFMRRIGGVAPIANLATSDLAAMGATADALGQQMEVSGTALSKFVMSVVNNTDGIAYALNMEEQELRDLISTGQTMEAIIKVLEAVKTNSDISGAAMGDMFKEFGSEGERMTRVIMTLANDTGFLRKQVELSRDAFNEAASATNEYNVKNENAAAIAQRIANAWQEFFVTADSTTGLTRLLNKLLDLTKFLTGASNGVAVFRTALATAATIFASTRLGLNKLGAGFSALMGWIESTEFVLLGHIRTLIVAKRGTDAYRGAVTALNASMKAFMASNWVTLILAGLTAVVTLVRNWNREQKELNSALVELNAEMRNEKKALDDVKSRLEDVKGLDKDRAALIREINRDYGSYIGHQLDEAAGYEEIADALKIVNEQLDLKYAKQIYAKRMEKADEKYTEDTEDTQKKLANRLAEMRKSSNDANSVYTDVLAAVKRFAREVKDPMEFLEKTSFDAVLKSFGQNNVGWKVAGDEEVEKYFKKLLSAEIEYNKASALAKAEQSANVDLQQQELAASQQAYIDNIKKQMLQLAQLPEETLKSMNEDELKAHYERIINYSNTLIKDAQRKYQEYVKNNPRLDGESDQAYTDRLKNQQEFLFKDIMMEDIRKAYAGDAWNKAYNLKGWKDVLKEKEKLATSNVDALVKTYKEMEEATAKFSDPEALGKVFEKDFKDIQEAQRFIWGLSEEIRLALEAQGRNTSGGFLKKKDQSGSMETQLRKELEAAKSALEAYYKEQERIINDAYMAGEITDKERLRRLSVNQQEMSRSFVDLYNVILGETKKYNTDFEKILPGKDLGKLSEQMTKWGAAMVDGMKNSRAENETKIQEEAIRLRQVIEKAMLEGDVFGKLERDFRETLDELSLLARNFGDSFDAVDSNMADGLVKELMKLSDKAYEVNEEGLKDLALQNTEYADWWNQVEGEQLTLLLEKLRVYYDDRLDVQRKYIQKAQREWKQQYKQSGGEAEYEQSKQSTETEYEQGKQSAERKYAQGKQVIAAEQGRQSAMSTLGSIKSAGDYNAERGVIMAEAGLEVEKITETSRLELEKISSTAERETQKIDSNLAFLEEKLKARALAINAELASMIEAERLVLAGLDPNSEEYAAQSNLIAGLEGTAVKQAVDSGDAESVALSGEIDTQVASRKSIETQATLDANAIIMQSELDTNAIIQQSAQETTESILEQWSQRAEALSGWAEMVGDTMGEVWMLERKANNARARGDEETAKKLEAQAKESRQNLVKEALNKAIDMAKVWAMELGFKIMYNALAKKSDEDAAAGGAKATLKGALAEVIANGFKGAGKEVGSKGMAGLITGAVIIAAAAGLAALAKSAVNKMFPEATEGVSDPEASTSAPKRKLTTGMLTYAEGKYPVLGNDGVVYDAEYAGANMKTGVYRKPHFGIFAEKQPEMVIDGKTTQRLVLNYPEIYSGILELSRTGRMGMRTYATGNVLEIGEGYDAQAHQAQQQMQMEAMNQTLAATAAAVAALTRRLDQPINASVNYFGKGGQREAEQRGSRWAARNRVK